jgi:hypothetical protein
VSPVSSVSVGLPLASPVSVAAVSDDSLEDPLESPVPLLDELAETPSSPHPSNRTAESTERTIRVDFMGIFLDSLAHQVGLAGLAVGAVAVIGA